MTRRPNLVTVIAFHVALIVLVAIVLYPVLLVCKKAFEPGRHYHGPLYRFPVAGISAVITAPVLLALARGAITELRELATGKTPFGFTKTLRDRASTQATLAEAEAMLRSARATIWRSPTGSAPFSSTMCPCSTRRAATPPSVSSCSSTRSTTGACAW